MKTLEKTITTQEVADKFFGWSQEGKFDQIVDELYGENAKSIEPADSFWKNVQGIDNIRAKSKEWSSNIEEMHGGYTDKPIVVGNFFSCAMGMDVTMKGQPRIKLDEIAVYEVRGGKIVLEQFFF